ncbi:DUF4114 domain-containing protein [Tenacibaculum maritimum]|nr:DUF4114 domain-containing protein [Tenacibaculum maritimum]MDB0612888.1 DUF4114 domain-containing protein [Tenacibaculum maritimum]
MKKILLSTILFLASWCFTAQNYNYLGTYTADGTPNYLESPGDDVPASTLELINDALPETFQVPTYNPHYITSGYDSDIYVTQTTDVYMTFVDEGAGFRNVIGFYTYDINNPPATAPSDEEITIIFPNNSKWGSGGGLQTGDKVKLGTFNAGTGIGFILISNGWNGNQVTYGYWRLYSNPNFNPETDVSKRHHNVLIKDNDNELIILGYEDIHREHSWCDHDFNDALYYITATNYTDIATTNIVSSDTSTDVYSANLGGFESKGDLSGKMALKNINRLKTNKEATTKQQQQLFNTHARSENDLAIYFPENGMFELEEAYVSTSTDLINYANATNVFSVDYYLDDERVSAALVTTTESKIYDHAKHICDRLNGSTLKDVRSVTMNGHRMIFSIIERDNGYIEYTVSFSILQGDTENKLLSLWNIGDYPTGAYMNFQIWGKSMGQLSHLINHIITKLSEQKTLVSASNITQHIPTVFISSATYKNKQLQLDFINKSATNNVTLNANIRNTEQLDFYNINQEISLTGKYNESITFETGFMFDGGFAILNKENATYDNVYLADGTWGIDYNADKTTVKSYVIHEQIDALNETVYQMERGALVDATTTGTFNLFRYPLAGDLALNTEDFNSIQLKIKNNAPVVISLVTPGINDWEDRWTYTIPVHEEEELISIRFDEFRNQAGSNNGSMDAIKMIMLSVHGTEETPVDFNLDVNEVAFANNALLSTTTFDLKKHAVFNTPNPFKTSTIIHIPQESNRVTLEVYDLLGRTIYKEVLNTLSNKKSIQYQSSKTNTGLYFYKLTDDANNIFKGKFMTVD